MLCRVFVTFSIHIFSPPWTGCTTQHTHALRCILHLLNYLPMILFRWQWDVWPVALGRYVDKFPLEPLLDVLMGRYDLTWCPHDRLSLCLHILMFLCLWIVRYVTGPMMNCWPCCHCRWTGWPAKRSWRSLKSRSTSRRSCRHSFKLLLNGKWYKTRYVIQSF